MTTRSDIDSYYAAVTGRPVDEVREGLARIEPKAQRRAVRVVGPSYRPVAQNPDPLDDVVRTLMRLSDAGDRRASKMLYALYDE